MVGLFNLVGRLRQEGGGGGAGAGVGDCERREKILLIIDTPRTMTPVVQIADEFSEHSRC